MVAVIGEDNAGYQGGPEPRSLIYHQKQRDALVKSGWKAIQESKGPAIIAARELVILMRRNKKLCEELNAKEELSELNSGVPVSLTMARIPV